MTYCGVRAWLGSETHVTRRAAQTNPVTQYQFRKTFLTIFYHRGIGFIKQCLAYEIRAERKTSYKSFLVCFFHPTTKRKLVPPPPPPPPLNASHNILSIKLCDEQINLCLVIHETIRL